MTEIYDAAVEVREALTGIADRLDGLTPIAEQLEGLNSLAERVDALGPILERVATALEQLAKQHHAASRAQHGPVYYTLLSEQEPD